MTTSFTTNSPLADAQKIGWPFANVVAAGSHSGLRSAEERVGLPGYLSEEEDCRLDFGADARAATGFSVFRYLTSPNQAPEHNAIAPSLLFCHVAHGVAHL